jgi:pimeloyl-ACP methyl ester carboxylesterase
MNDLLNHPIISQRYFFPRRGFISEPFIVDVDGAQLACSYHEVDPQAKTLVHFHGNGEIVDDWQGGFVEAIAQAGCNCFLAEYRGYGSSTGEAQLGNMLNDVGPTLAALQLPPEQMIIFGRSVGAIFALEAIRLFPDVAGLVIESGIADVRERLLLRIHPQELGASLTEFDAVIDARLNQQRKLAAYPGPVLIMHTRNDGLVSVRHAEKLHDWATGRKELKIFAAGDHNDIMLENARDYFSTLARFIASL